MFLGPDAVLYEHTPRSRNGNYRSRNHPPTAADLARHLEADWTIGVGKAAQIFSLDLDLSPKGSTVSREAKLAGLARLYERVPILPCLPVLIADSARGLHLHLEVFGRAGNLSCIRLPFGMYEGELRNTFPRPRPSQLSAG